MRRRATRRATARSSVICSSAASTSLRRSSRRCSSRSLIPTTTSTAPWRRLVSSPATTDVWETIVGEAVAESSLWGDALKPEADRDPEPVFSPLAEERFALGLETIYEGYLVHYGEPRVFAPPDPDSALLLGDYLYAHGLVRVASFGDADAVGDLSELISLCSQLRAEGAAGDGPLW